MNIKKNSFLFGILLGLFLLYYFSYAKKDIVNYKELALGKETSSSFELLNKKKIHCQDFEDLEDCILSYKKYGKNYPITLWLGNSQIHSINQYQKGQKTAPAKLHKLGLKHKQYVITLSQPNANLQEHYLILTHIINKLPIKNLILPVVFDDMRESGIRYSLIDMMHDDNTVKELNKSIFGKKLFQNNLSKDSNNIFHNNDNQSLEKILEKKLSSTWFLWGNRDVLRGDFFNFLYRLRNFIFQIEPTTTRRMLIGHYKINHKAVEEIIKLTKDFKIKTFVYVAPIRNDMSIPYNKKDYENFKSDLYQLTLNNNFIFKNLENIVPNQLWGNRLSTNLKEKNEIDFMHFKEEGHTILSKNIYFEFVKIWEE